MVVGVTQTAFIASLDKSTQHSSKQKHGQLGLTARAFHNKRHPCTFRTLTWMAALLTSDLQCECLFHTLCVCGM